MVADEKASNEEEAKMLEFSGDEETLIIRMFNLVGDRQIFFFSLIYLNSIYIYIYIQHYDLVAIAWSVCTHIYMQGKYEFILFEFYHLTARKYH